MSRLFGAHMSVAGGLAQAFPRALAVGATAVQIFTKNANRWSAPPPTADEITAFRDAWQQSGIGPVMVHDAYLINLAATDEANWERSKAAMREELQRCALLGIPHLIAHPGAHVGAGVEAGIARIRAALTEIFAESDPAVRLLLENTAGQGTYLGGEFQQLAWMMDGFGERVGICFDSCHAHAAGYDLASAEGYERTMTAFEQEIGWRWLFAFHLNDSLKGCGSRVDRHAHIGEGSIGAEGFARLVRDERFVHLPMILETPKGDDGAEMDRVNLALLRKLAGDI
ncbi:MAG: deoxyribonuclease IV [Desulfuromonadales bacterium]|nr:deoxyribonuclease IV [Desulfuromonadales bacterium]